MSISRRTFIKGTLASPLLVSVGCGNAVEAAPIVDATVDDDPKSPRYGQIQVFLSIYPDLAAPGGAVSLQLSPLPQRPRPFIVPEHGVLLIHRGSSTDEPEFVATRADCPHLGCPLGYSARDRLIECPCHSSRFLAVSDANVPSQCAGLVTRGPARDNLTVYGVEQSGGAVYVSLMTDQSCGTSANFPSVVNGTITLPLALFQALAQVGGSVVGKPSGLNDKLIVARVAENTVVTLSAICTHQGCTVALGTGADRLRCPCHGSEFSLAGQVISSPAVRPLGSYPTVFDGETVVITVPT